ncbi:MAG TPA: wax ester/triacylglycerol synthase domain-containing protein [Mycobacteriales bacterium]|nr:wax ester/triacylglycerol synthase domain-containing protein [Mycobacteriales bacterium]
MSRRERMSPADAAWLRMDRPTNLMVINGVVWFDAPLDWDVLTKRIESRWIDRYPRFRQRVVEGRLPMFGPQWEDDPRFALENHLHHIALPAPGDQAALEKFVGDRMSAPIDRAKPLWHAYSIDGYGPGCAVLVRVHHSVADGIALAQVLQSLTDDAPEADERDDDRRGGRRRGWTSLLDPITKPTGAAVGAAWRLTGAVVNQGLDVVTHPKRLGDVAATGWDDAAALAKLVFTPPAARTAVTGETVVAKRAVWSPPIPLEDVKAVGRATGATVNDVLLASVTGGYAATCRRTGAWSTTSARSCRSTCGPPTDRCRRPWATGSGSCSSTCPSLLPTRLTGCASSPGACSRSRIPRRAWSPSACSAGSATPRPRWRMRSSTSSPRRRAR